MTISKFDCTDFRSGMKVNTPEGIFVIAGVDFKWRQVNVCDDTGEDVSFSYEDCEIVN